MLSFKIGNTTVEPAPLLFVVLIFLVTLLITGIVKTRQIKAMKKLCQSGDYEKSVVLANKLLTYFTRSYRLFHAKSTKAGIEAFHVWLAISYLGLSQYDLFWEHINKVEQLQNLKYCWMGTYYILQKDIDQVKLCKDKIEPTEETQNTLDFFTGVILYEEGKVSEGKEILSRVLPNLHFELLKQIVLQYTA